MCTPPKPKIAKIADPPAAPEAPPEVPVTVADPLATKAAGRNPLRIDLAAGNTSLGKSGLNI